MVRKKLKLFLLVIVLPALLLSVAGQMSLPADAAADCKGCAVCSRTELCNEKTTCTVDDTGKSCQCRELQNLQ